MGSDVRLRAVLPLLAVGLVACGPTSVSKSPSPVTSSTSTSSPTPASPALTAVYMVRITTAGRSAGDALHEVTVTRGASSDRVLENADRIRELLAAGNGFAIEIDGGSVDGSNTLKMVDLVAGGGHSLGSLNTLGIGQPGPVGGALSPDGSQIAIGGAHKMLLVQLPSGSARTLFTVSTQKWLLPVRWTAAGIITKEVSFHGAAYDLVNIDPQTGKLSILSPSSMDVVSPDGRLAAGATHIDLGDGASLGQGPWLNTLNLTQLGGAETQVASEKDHNFTPLDLGNDGQLLFDSDSQPGAAVAAHMGFYLATNGRLTQQLPLGFYNEWGSGRFLDTSTALVARIRGGSLDTETGVDLELVHLCADTSGSCRVTTATVSSTSGSWPTEVLGIIVIPATS